MNIYEKIIFGDINKNTFDGRIDPKKLASYLQEEREAREALEKNLASWSSLQDKRGTDFENRIQALEKRVEDA